MTISGVSPAYGQKKPARHRPSPPAAVPAPAADVPITTSSLARNLPADSLLFLELNDLPGAIDEVLRVEELRKLLAAIPHNPISDPSHYDQFLTALGFPDKTVLSATRLGASLRVVLLPPSPAKTTKTKPSSEPAEPAPRMAVLIDAPTAEAGKKICDTVARLAAQAGAPKPVPLAVGKTQIITYPDSRPATTAAYTQLGKLIIAGQLPEVQWLATRLNQPSQTSLAATADFATVDKQLGNTRNLTCYINTKAISDLISQSLSYLSVPPKPATAAKTGKKNARGKTKPVTPPEKSVWETLAANTGNYLGLPSTGGIGLSATVANGQLTQRVFWAVDRTGKGLFPILADAPTVTLRTANFIPNSTQAYAVFGVNHLRLYDETLAILRSLPTAKDNPPDALIGMAEMMTGFKIRDDFLAAFSGEFAVACDIKDFNRFFSGKVQPSDIQVVGYAVMKNPAAARSAIEKIRALETRRKNEDTPEKESAPSLPEKETVQGTDILRVGKIGLAFLDDVLAIGSVDTLKQTIDAWKTGKTLGQDETFRKAMKDFPNNSMASVYASESYYTNVLNSLRNEMTPEMQNVVAGCRPQPYAVHIQREALGVRTEVALPLSNLVLAAALIEPSMRISKRTTNQAIAQSFLRQVHRAQLTYQQGIGKGNFAATMTELKNEPNNANLSEDFFHMQTLEEHGYQVGQITLLAAAENSPAKYSVTVIPRVKTGLERTGDDAYFIDETGVIRHSGSATVVPDAKSDPLNR